MRASAAIALMLAGCSLTIVNQPAPAGHALVQIARLPSGEPAVVLRSLHSKHLIRSQDIDPADQIPLRPGTYLAELECGRPGGRMYLHAFPTFRFSVRADAMYVIDCSPNANDDGFLLRSLPDSAPGQAVGG